jgi:hypothetical protein
MASRIAHTPHDVHESLQTILQDEPTFQKVVDTVFGNIKVGNTDESKSGALDAEELAAYMVRGMACALRGGNTQCYTRI